MKHLCCLFFLQISISAVAQEYPSYIDWDAKSIVKSFHDLSEENKKYDVVLVDSGRVIRFSISGHEKIDCEFEMDSLGYCEFANFTYCCTDCSDKHLNEFLNDPYYGWKKKGGFTYISKRRRKTVMTVHNSNPEVTVLSFERRNWTRQWYHMETASPYDEPAVRIPKKDKKTE